MRLLLIRHGMTDEVGRVLTGWAAGVHINAVGRAQAERVAERLATLPIRAVYTSPIDRTRETAEIVAGPHRLKPVAREGIGEVRLGEWQGRTFEQMESVPGWREFNSYRSGTRPPGGESALELQARVVGEIERMRSLHGEDDVVVAVSHADVIRAALLHYGGIPHDLFLRWSIGPTSVTVIDLRPWGPTIVAVNDTGGPPWL